MDVVRCPRCNRPLLAMTDRTGKTELRCLKCDKVNPMKISAGGLANVLPQVHPRSRPIN
jgi:phage FluMu protein Com